jgi:hypothetical protein
MVGFPARTNEVGKLNNFLMEPSYVQLISQAADSAFEYGCFGRNETPDYLPLPPDGGSAQRNASARQSWRAGCFALHLFYISTAHQVEEFTFI